MHRPLFCVAIALCVFCWPATRQYVAAQPLPEPPLPDAPDFGEIEYEDAEAEPTPLDEEAYQYLEDVAVGSTGSGKSSEKCGCGQKAVTKSDWSKGGLCNGGCGQKSTEHQKTCGCPKSYGGKASHQKGCGSARRVKSCGPKGGYGGATCSKSDSTALLGKCGSSAKGGKGSLSPKGLLAHYRPGNCLTERLVCLGDRIDWCCWYGDIEFYFLARSDRGRQVAANANLNQTLLSDAGSFDAEFGAGITVGRRWDECHALEFKYFGLDDSTATSASAVDAGNWAAAAPFNTIGTQAVFLTADQYTQSYASEMQSAELNWITTHDCRWKSLIGVRYVQQDEKYSLLADGANDGTYNVTAMNHLIGVQVGIQWNRPLSSRLSLEADARAGLYANIMDIDATLDDQTTVGADRVFVNHESALAGVYQVEASAVYCLSDHCKLRASYNLFWLDGMALASEQFNPQGADESGSVFYHGPSVALQLNY